MKEILIIMGFIALIAIIKKIIDYFFIWKILKSNGKVSKNKKDIVKSILENNNSKKTFNLINFKKKSESE